MPRQTDPRLIAIKRGVPALHVDDLLAQGFAYDGTAVTPTPRLRFGRPILIAQIRSPVRNAFNMIERTGAPIPLELDAAAFAYAVKGCLRPAGPFPYRDGDPNNLAWSNICPVRQTTAATGATSEYGISLHNSVFGAQGQLIRKAHFVVQITPPGWREGVIYVSTAPTMEHAKQWRDGALARWHNWKLRHPGSMPADKQAMQKILRGGKPLARSTDDENAL